MQTSPTIICANFSENWTKVGVAVGKKTITACSKIAANNKKKFVSKQKGLKYYKQKKKKRVKLAY